MSKFGRGLTYCIGLFLAHEGEAARMRETYARLGLSGANWSGLWFNGASDHLYELQVGQAPPELQERLQRFKDEALHFGHGFSKPRANEDDVYRLIKEAKRLLLKIDEAHGVDVEEAEYP